MDGQRDAPLEDGPALDLRAAAGLVVALAAGELGRGDRADAAVALGHVARRGGLGLLDDGDGLLRRADVEFGKVAGHGRDDRH